MDCEGPWEKIVEIFEYFLQNKTFLIMLLDQVCIEEVVFVLS